MKKYIVFMFLVFFSEISLAQIRTPDFSVKKRQNGRVLLLYSGKVFTGTQEDAISLVRQFQPPDQLRKLKDTILIENEIAPWTLLLYVVIPDFEESRPVLSLFVRKRGKWEWFESFFDNVPEGIAKAKNQFILSVFFPEDEVRVWDIYTRKNKHYVLTGGNTVGILKKGYIPEEDFK